MQTAELEGAALDWAVVEAQKPFDVDNWGSFSHEWELTGPIMQRERITVAPAGDAWRAYYAPTAGLHCATGATPQEAIARAFVMRHLGAVVDVPPELEPLA